MDFTNFQDRSRLPSSARPLYFNLRLKKLVNIDFSTNIDLNEKEE
jgi:hypothetical protein